MAHVIRVSAAGCDRSEVTELLATLPAVQVLDPWAGRSGLALDSQSAQVIVEGLTDVGILITAVSGIWVAKLKRRDGSAAEPANPLARVVVETRADEVVLRLTEDGIDTADLAGRVRSVDDIVA